MSKTDFEFYAIPGLPGEFVRPAPQNDKYGGQVRLDDYRPELPPSLVTLDSEQLAQPYTNGSCDPNGRFRFFFRQSLEHARTDLIVRRQKLMQIPIDPKVVEQIGYGTLPVVGRIHDEFIVNRANKNTPAGPVVTQNIQSYGYLIGGHDEPTHAAVEIAEAAHATAYRWEPGPPRGPEKQLPPTYNPVPHSVLFLSTLSLSFINPLVPSPEFAQ